LKRTAYKEAAMTAPREMKNMTLRMEETLADTVQAIAQVEGSSVSDVIRTAICEHVERRKADPEFQKLLKRNMERHAELLNMLANG
jgi:predicted transcriptional regulator